MNEIVTASSHAQCELHTHGTLLEKYLPKHIQSTPPRVTSGPEHTEWQQTDDLLFRVLFALVGFTTEGSRQTKLQDQHSNV